VEPLANQCPFVFEYHNVNIEYILDVLTKVRDLLWSIGECSVTDQVELRRDSK
jgi:hypothetical protein